MKKILAFTAIITSAAFAASASAVTLYQDGVTTADSLTLTDLIGDGWSSVLDVTYETTTDQAQILNLQTVAGSASVFVGAVNAVGDVIVGATGLASEVLSVTTSLSSATSYASSNLNWYNVAGESFGFTAISDIILNAADVKGSGLFSGGADDGNNDLRLSWHNSSDVGGWRAGSIYQLNESTDYRKIILVSTGNVSVPDTGSTLALFGLALSGLAIVRRRRS